MAQERRELLVIHLSACVSLVQKLSLLTSVVDVDLFVISSVDAIILQAKVYLMLCIQSALRKVVSQHFLGR